MTPDRRPMHFLAQCSKGEWISPANPQGLHPSWLIADADWLIALRHPAAQRVMLARPAGATAGGSQVRFAHYRTLPSHEHREALAEAAAVWRQTAELGLYFGRWVSPPDTLDWLDHQPPTGLGPQLDWVWASLQPYYQLGFHEFGIDAATTLTNQEWGALKRMIRAACGAEIRILAEAVPFLEDGAPDMRAIEREPCMCLWRFLYRPEHGIDRTEDNRWIFDPATTEVHVLLTAAEAAEPGRVAMLESRGYVVSCRNQWWR